MGPYRANSDPHLYHEPIPCLKSLNDGHSKEQKEDRSICSTFHVSIVLLAIARASKLVLPKILSLGFQFRKPRVVVGKLTQMCEGNFPCRERIVIRHICLCIAFAMFQFYVHAHAELLKIETRITPPDADGISNVSRLLCGEVFRRHNDT